MKVLFQKCFPFETLNLTKKIVRGTQIGENDGGGDTHESKEGGGGVTLCARCSNDAGKTAKREDHLEICSRKFMCVYGKRELGATVNTFAFDFVANPRSVNHIIIQILINAIHNRWRNYIDGWHEPKSKWFYANLRHYPRIWMNIVFIRSNRWHDNDVRKLLEISRIENELSGTYMTEIMIHAQCHTAKKSYALQHDFWFWRSFADNKTLHELCSTKAKMALNFTRIKTWQHREQNNHGLRQFQSCNELMRWTDNCELAFRLSTFLNPAVVKLYDESFAKHVRSKLYKWVSRILAAQAWTSDNLFCPLQKTDRTCW